MIPKFQKVLNMHARFVSADADIDPNMPIDSLGIDSFGMIELITYIQNEFGLEIPPEDVTPKTFATPASIWRLLCQIDPTLAEE